MRELYMPPAADMTTNVPTYALRLDALCIRSNHWFKSSSGGAGLTTGEGPTVAWTGDCDCDCGGCAAKAPACRPTVTTKGSKAQTITRRKLSAPEAKLTVKPPQRLHCAKSRQASAMQRHPPPACVPPAIHPDADHAA